MTYDEVIKTVSRMLVSARAAGVSLPVDHYGEAFEFLLRCRVSKVTEHVSQDSLLTATPSTYRKVRLRGRIGPPGGSNRLVVKSVLLTSNPCLQILKAFDLLQAEALAPVVWEGIPASVKEELQRQLSERVAAMEVGDGSRVEERLKAKWEEAWAKRRATDHRRLVKDLRQLQERGWTEDDLLSAWKEAIVREVMES
jgi:hypothetical protein